MAESAMQTPESAGNTLLIKWLNIANGDDGKPLLAFEHSDISVQVVVNTLGTGGSLNLEGSNDGVNYHALTDPQGNALTFVATRLEQVTEICKFYRPHVTAGDGTTDFSVFLFLRRGR